MRCLKVILLFLSFCGYSQQQFFVENKGQWDDEVAYTLETGNIQVLLAKNKIGYILTSQKDLAKYSEHPHGEKSDHSSSEKRGEPGLIGKHFVQVAFIGANENARLTGLNPQVTNINYLYGNDPQKWVTEIHPYGGVLYHDIYENINLKFLSNGNGPKYEFVVKPHANPDNIALSYEGADELLIENGGLRIRTSQGDFYEAPPFVYQERNGTIDTVRARFRLKKKVVSFDLLEPYDPALPLILDPQLIFSSYSGSAADNWGNTACVDLEGNLYSGGTVFWHNGSGIIPALSGFPTTPGAYRSTWQGGETDMGILKFDSAGTTLLYATYIGGNESEIPTSMVADDQGFLYILGVTSSTNYPTTSGAFATSFGGGTSLNSSDLVGGHNFDNGTDLVITKLNQNGTAIVSSTFVGGNGNDGIILYADELANNYGDHLRGDINLDSEGNVCVVSSTSGGFPVQNGPQLAYGGGATDAVVFKISNDLSTMLWSSYLGGNEDDAGFGMAIDAKDNLYVGGGTRSLDFPTTSGAYKTNAGNNVDGYISKLSKDGSSILASTRLGTGFFDQVYFVQLDEEGFPHALGQTKGLYPVSSGTYSNKISGVFIHKLNPDLTTSEFSTVIGSGSLVPNISPTAFLINECGNILISGWGGQLNAAFNGGNTYNMPITSNAFQKKTDGNDFYLMALSKNAEELLYATYFGGNGSEDHVDGGTSRFDKRGIVYQSVCASCSGIGRTFGDPRGMPISSRNVASPVNGSVNCNNGVFKFDLASVIADFEVEDTCLNSKVSFINKSVGGARFKWLFGDGDSLETSSKKTVSHKYKSFGKFTVTLIAYDRTTCIGSDTMSKDIFINFLDEGAYFRDTVCLGNSVQLSVSDNPSGLWKYQWSPPDYLDDPTSPTPVSTPLKRIKYTVTITDTSGCSKEDVFEVYVDHLVPDFTANILGNCIGVPEVCFLNTTTGLEPKFYFWSSANWSSFAKSPCHSFNEYGEVKVKLTAMSLYCGRVDTTKTIKLEEVMIPNVFTPNGDDKNEAFYINGLNNSGDWEVEVFNRWGKQIFKDEQYQNNWDASEQSDGIYYYRVVSPQGKECKGWVEVIR